MGVLERLTKYEMLSYRAKEYLMTKYPKTFSFKPIENYFFLDRGAHTDFCDIHDNCLKFSMGWASVPVCHGYWYLSTPIDKFAKMPGTEHELDSAGIKASIGIGWGTIILENSRGFGILSGDGTELWAVYGGKIRQGDGEDNFKINKYVEIDKSLDAVSHIDVAIAAVLRCLTGGFTCHYREPWIQIMYVPEVAPEPGTVRVWVLDRKSGTGVKNAYVALISAGYIVADGYTAGTGWVEFTGVPGGMEGISYELMVVKGGYYEYTDDIDVMPGENPPKIVYINPIPTVPMPDWVWYAVAGIGGLAAITILPSVIKRKEKPPIIVVK